MSQKKPINNNKDVQRRRALLKLDLTDIIAPTSSINLSEEKGPRRSSELPPEGLDSLSDTDIRSPRQRIELSAYDVHAFCSMAVRNAKTPPQMRQAIADVGKCGTHFNKELADLTERLATGIDQAPMERMCLALKNENFDSFVTISRGSVAEQCREGQKRSQEFAEFASPAALRAHFKLEDDARLQLIKGATEAATFLTSSAAFKADLENLRNHQAPRISITPDTYAQNVVVKMMATLCLVWEQTLERALSKILLSSNRSDFTEVVGLSGVVAPSLMALASCHVIGKVVSDCNLSEQLPRLRTVCQAVRSTGSFANSNTFKDHRLQDVSLSIQRVLRFVPPLEAAILFKQGEAELVEFTRYARTISDTEILPLTERTRCFPYERPLHIHLGGGGKTGFLATVGPHNADLTLGVVQEGLESKLRIQRICVSPSGEAFFPRTLSLFPLSDTDFRNLAPDKPDLHSMSEMVTRVAGHALFVLRTLEEAFPDLLRRVQELPDDLGLELLDGNLILTIQRQHLDALLALFEHDPECYQRLVDATGFSTGEQPTDPHQVLHFVLANPIASKQVGHNESNAAPTTIVSMPTDEVATRRAVSSLLRSNVKNFEQLLEILSSDFDVQLTNQGKGDHKMLTRGGYRFTLAPKYRDPNEPLNIPITNQLLNALHISRAELKQRLENAERA